MPDKIVPPEADNTMKTAFMQKIRKKINNRKSRQFSISRKLLIGFTVVILIMSSVAAYPMLSYNSPIKKLNKIMDNITLANDTLTTCFELQKQLKEVLRDYTRDKGIIDNKKVRDDYNERVQKIKENVKLIRQNHISFKMDSDNPASKSMDTFERMLETYISKADVIMKQDSKISVGERSSSYETLLIYKDAVERGDKDFIAAEIEFSKTVRGEISELTQNIAMTSIVVLITLVLLCAIIAVFVSRSISVPIKKITHMVGRIAEGDLEVERIEIKSHDELSRLGDFFNLMVIRLKKLMEQIVHEQEEKRKKEFEVLQAQINPHFLYNTLDSVVRLIGKGKSEDAIVMISSLSKLFRISLSKGKSIITIQDELEHARHYLNIQKARFKNRFEFEILAQDEVLPYKTLKLILQPIIENSVHHGLEYSMDEGLIKVTAERVENKVLLQVEDNGVGISPEKLEQILSGQLKSERGSGVALKNVHDRIRLYFGNEYGLDIKSRLEEGTIVSVWLPVIEEIL